MKKFLLAVVIVLVLTVATAAIAINYQRPIRTISAEDDSQTLLIQYRLPTRLVVLDAATGRLLLQLGLSDRVVGVSSEAAPDFPGVELLGSVGEVRAVSIVALRPDLVVLSKQSAELAQTLREGGVRVWLTDPASLEGLCTGITRLGKLVGQEEQASALAEQLKGQLSDLQRSAADPTPIRVLFWVDQMFTAAGQATLESDLIAAAGGLNVLGVGGYVPLPVTEVSLAAPDVVFIPASLATELSGQQFVPPPDVIEQQQSQTSTPQQIILPADFHPVTWENALARVSWLQQQLSASGR